MFLTSLLPLVFPDCRVIVNVFVSPGAMLVGYSSPSAMNELRDLLPDHMSAPFPLPHSGSPAGVTSLIPMYGVYTVSSLRFLIEISSVISSSSLLLGLGSVLTCLTLMSHAFQLPGLSFFLGLLALLVSFCVVLAVFAVLLAVLLLPQAAAPIVSSAAVVIAVICLLIVFTCCLRVRFAGIIYKAQFRIVSSCSLRLR